MAHDVFKTRYFRCECGSTFSDLRWGLADPPACQACQKEMFETGDFKLGRSASIHGDEIDIDVRHGLCNDDGTPRKFRSKAELKQAAYDAGLSIYGDTPNPNPRIVEQRARQAEERAASLRRHER